MLAAGVQMSSLMKYMGHSSITVTADRYGYLQKGSEAKDAGKLDTLLAEAV